MPVDPREHRGVPSFPAAREHRAPVLPHPAAPPVAHPVVPPVVLPVTPPVVVPPVHAEPPTQPAGAPWHPPEAHHHHRDYVYVESWGWWPSWFPYWDPYWYWYWQYLYFYYGGDEHPEYAEYARDVVLRQLAPQQGWL